MASTTAAASEARGSVRVERGTKRVRAYLGGELVADTTRPWCRAVTVAFGSARLPRA